MKKVDAKSFGAVYIYTHTIHLLTKVSLLNVDNVLKLCLLSKIVNKYNKTKTEIEPIY